MTAKRVNVLVISDNAELTKYFKQETERQNCNDIALFEYAFSSINKNPAPMKELGAKGVNVKEASFLNDSKAKYSLIISLHCKQIFPASLVSAITCVNFHPGLNPYNRGWYPQVFSIINKMPIGATLHIMDEEVDHGDIIDQKEVVTKRTDTSLELYNRVIEAEKVLIRKNLLSLVNNNFLSKKMPGSGNYNSLEDFKKLCELDLTSEGSLEDHINLLRALSHGDFSNSFFIDDEGDKNFVKIFIYKEK